MGTPFAVSLDVRNYKSTDPGWVSVKASNGADYSFKYAGGSDGNGNIDETSRGQADITVSLVCDARYRIHDVHLKDDPKNQLSKQQVADRSAVVRDKNDKVESNAYYSIVVKDTGNSDCTFDCDPKISNDP